MRAITEMTMMNIKRDFMKELKAICRQEPKIETVKERLYNIYKVSIPICINKPIILGLTRQEAVTEVARLVRLEKERREREGTSVLFMFDIKAVDAKPFELSVFYNEGPVCL